MDLSIIIINYMTYSITINALESIFKNTKGIDYEVILLDNASENQDVSKFVDYLNKSNENVKLVKNAENSGFGKGNNIAVKQATGKYLVFFNSDCELTENTFKKCIDYMDGDNDIGVVGPRLMSPDGKLDNGCKRGFPTPKASFYYLIGMHKISKNPKFDRYKLFHLDEFKIAEVDAVSGAFLFTRKDIFEKVGGFDKNYFMYGEDLDFCHCVKEMGYKVIYNPDTGNVIHYRGESGKHRKFKTLYNFYEAMILFYNKYYKNKKNFLVTAAVYTAVGVMFLLKTIAGVFKKRDKTN
ncbi:MAG: glycosyltransferase family 2 protein [Clostridiales bacterium]|nr:glycosyltransferase family 2 protein [Clostridiales bacterium]